MSNPDRPRVFIGSSTEGLHIAESLQFNLENHAEVTVWNQRVFLPTANVIATLGRVAESTDFAAFVLTPDDLVVQRNRIGTSPRDNLLFEAGYFMAGLGGDRTFLLVRRDADLVLPTDLDGLLVLRYSSRLDDNHVAATAPAALQMRQVIRSSPWAWPHHLGSIGSIHRAAGGS